jgi:hypothetical protein
MARYQYRLNGQFSWVSSPGNALLALQNKSGSGKRITIRSLEIQNQSAWDTVNTNRGFDVGTAEGALFDRGDPVPVVPMDTTASLHPNIRVRTGGGFIAYGDPYTKTTHRNNNEYSTAGFNLLNRNGIWPAGRFPRVISSSVQKRNLNSGNMWALYTTKVSRSASVEASVRFTTGGKTYVASAVGIAVEGGALISIENNTVGEVVQIIDYSFRMLGATSVTPYLQVAPFSAADPSAIESNSIASFLKMDTAYPDANTWVRAVYDTPLIPSGAPIEYANPIGAGAPKGANYLQTKDFLGPVFRALFPENLSTRVDAGVVQTDSLGFLGHQHSDLLARSAGLVLRPGEGLAVVASAETFGNAAATIGGEIPIFVGINFDIENEVQPYLTLTGLQTGSDIVILEAGTGNFLQQIDAYSGTSWIWAYDSDIVTSVDVCVYKPGFVPLALRNVSTPAQGLSIPIVQTPDRNYI